MTSSTGSANDPAAALDAFVGKAVSLMSGTHEPVDVGPFTGSAAEGAVRCEVGGDGRVRSVEIDPRALRMPVEDLCVHLVTALNEAIDARPAGPDTRPLLEGLKALQEQSVHEMRRITQTFTDALNESARSRS